MTDEHEMAEATGAPTRHSGATSAKLVIVLVVVAVFAGVLTAKTIASRPAPGAAAGPALTSIHNDAVADYEVARKSGRPVYVLFHSLS